GSPAIASGRIVVGTDGGRLVCLDAGTGRQVWAFDQVENKAMVYSSPAIASGVVVVGARDHGIWAIDLATGAKKWRVPTRGDVDASPAISAGRVYVPSKDKLL